MSAELNIMQIPDLLKNTTQCDDKTLQLKSLQTIKTCLALISAENPLSIEHLLSFYQAWAALDLHAALAHVVAQPAEISSYLIYDVVSTASSDNLNSVLAWLDSQTLEENLKSDLLVSAYVGASANNQTSILSLAESLSNPQLKAQVMDSILVDWAQQDYNAALAWIDGRERSDMYHTVVNNLVLNLLELQPSEALYYLELMPENPQKTKLLARYAHSAATEDLNSTLSWAQALDNPTERAAVLTTILDLAVAEPQNNQFAWQMALNETEPNMQQHLLLNVAQNIANQDVLWLVERFDVIPDGSQAEIAQIIVKKWREKDEEAASNWANSLEINPQPIN
ncbi:hypothetical protein [Catenovulum sp. 2E275]|uniref:hypothetical protein n=1 Tax=Catenovulum sp. 2E275 TaxID=2980497 RepID=UPI0021D30105|nr:hypothetical protein [Catenovulum sp. 2E275]